MNDARFEDGAERPLRLVAQDADDLRVVSALVQDAVLTASDLKFMPRQRRFALLVNRFRWEDSDRAQLQRRPFERVRAVLEFGDVLRATHQGLDQRDPSTVLSLLRVDFIPATTTDPGQPAGPGRVHLIFAGDGVIALEVECLDARLADVTRPYAAPSRRAPDHGPD